MIVPTLFDPPAPVHPNSLSAWQTLDLDHREREVCEALARIGRPATDREVLAAVGRTDPNYVRPRITELIDAGTLAETGDVACAVTGRKVRRVFFRERVKQ